MTVASQDVQNPAYRPTPPLSRPHRHHDASPWWWWGCLCERGFIPAWHHRAGPVGFHPVWAQSGVFGFI